MSVNWVFLHVDVLNGSVDREDFLDVLFVNVASEAANVDLRRAGRRSRSPLPAPDNVNYNMQISMSGF